MHPRKGQSGFSPLSIATTVDKSTGHPEHYEDAVSPQSSVCVQSASGQDPIITRGELISILNAIFSFARHYAAVYHGLGCSYHLLPFSARGSKWVVEGMRVRTDEALTASNYKQLPDLVYIFSEISHRLEHSQNLLFGSEGEWRASEQQLRRCDTLLLEAELRLRFLQAGVGNMWFTIGRDQLVDDDEGEVLARARAAFEKRWLSVLPQISFADSIQSDLQSRVTKGWEYGRRWASWSG